MDRIDRPLKEIFDSEPIKLAAIVKQLGLNQSKTYYQILVGLDTQETRKIRAYLRKLAKRLE